MDADALTLFLGSFFTVAFLPARLVGLDRSPFDFGMPAQWCPLGESNVLKVGPRKVISRVLGSCVCDGCWPNTISLVNTSNSQSVGVKCGRCTCFRNAFLLMVPRTWCTHLPNEEESVYPRAASNHSLDMRRMNVSWSGADILAKNWGLYTVSPRSSRCCASR